MKNVSKPQLACLHIKWDRLRADGDPRANGPRGQVYEHDRDGRLAWARAHLGVRALASFSDLSQTQAGYLLDLVAGKQTRLDTKLCELFRAAGIAHPAEWFAATMAATQRHGRGMWLFAGAELATLNRYQKWRLAELLSTRAKAPENVRTAGGSPGEAMRSRVSPAPF